MADQNHLAWRGTTVSKSLVAGMTTLYETLRIQLATRTMAKYNNDNKLTCETYFTLTSMDPTAVPEACAGVNFDDVDQLMVYVQGQMASDTSAYRTEIKATTGATTQELNEFYDTSTTGSFGQVL
jgi:hypothetical protein